MVYEKISTMDKYLPDTNLEFIKRKIYELNTALMYGMSNELIRTPNCVATALKVDHEGNLWFSFKAPLQYINEYEECFPVRLNFFRKGISFHMTVSGRAIVIKNEEDRQRFLQDDNQAMLMKMSMMNIEYAEPSVKTKSRWNIMAENLYDWFIRATALPRTATSVLEKLQQHNAA
jgi:hypothetical protein